MGKHAWALPACRQADLAALEPCQLAFASAVHVHRRRPSGDTTLAHIPEALLGSIAAQAFAFPERT